MKNRLLLIIIPLFILALIAVLGFTRNSDSRLDDHKDLHDHVAEGSCRHGEEEEKNDLTMSIEEITNAECEHKIPTYQCEECRYEVGTVKVEKDLIVSEQNQGKGLVRVVTAQRERVTVALTTTGEIKSNEKMTVHVTPRIEGTILSVNVDAGAQVRRNDPLFSIESAAIGEALREYLKACASADLREGAYAREKSLFDQKISPEQDMLEAKSALQEARADLKAAKQRLHVLGLSDKDIGLTNPDDRAGLQKVLTVRAPIDGTIIEKHAAIGELVQPDTDVMLLADLDTVWVWADIYEGDLSRLLNRMKDGPTFVEIRQTAFPGEVFSGKLDYVSATMDEQTRTIKVRATINNEKRLLRPGVFCEAAIWLSADEDVLAVPGTALMSDEGISFVYKHMKDDYYVRRQVKKGREFASSVEIIEGILPGDLIVSEGAFLLKSDTLRSKMGAGCAD